MRKILSDAKTTAPKSVGTWAMQASFAAKGDWPGLDAYLRTSMNGARPAHEPASAAPPPKPDDLTQLTGVGSKGCSPWSYSSA